MNTVLLVVVLILCYCQIFILVDIHKTFLFWKEFQKSLQLLTRSVASKEEAPYLLVHMHGTQTLELLLRCLSNIDEEVLRHACDALYCLISRCEPARLLLLRRRGIADLAECLRDYNTAIKATSLQILCVLAAESGAARHEMRQEEVLMEVLKTVQAFPAEDVTPHVLTHRRIIL